MLERGHVRSSLMVMELPGSSINRILEATNASRSKTNKEPLTETGKSISSDMKELNITGMQLGTNEYLNNRLETRIRGLIEDSSKGTDDRGLEYQRQSHRKSSLGFWPFCPPKVLRDKLEVLYHAQSSPPPYLGEKE
ncbi:unnamed protein product [Nezara viridula]|uniref:Uncharacterized protein n=1 Tax=Nezara viridula TaxID=85310 RepID=A0A9P0MQ26_NEZVI|nr:unnamed protein product [Nezara viridula]